jgi:GntR family transcriptional regulator/MocR family aminotransferase
MQLTMDGHGARHAQLARALRAAIHDGRLRSGARLPASRDMAMQLRVSRNTVIAAYEQLRVEGYVHARVGSGTYVSEVDVARSPPVRVAPVAAPTRFVARMRAIDFRILRRSGDGIRWDMQLGEPVTDPALFTAWRRTLARAALYADPRYPHSAGLPALREALAEYLARRRGVDTSPNEIVIVSGTQQGIGLVARVLVEERDRVALEEPHYFGARMALQAHGARLSGVPVDADGLVVERLPARAPRLVCVTPAHQFPLGATMSLARRQALLDYAASRRCWIVEDDYDSEFRYDSQPLPALRSLDRGDRVIHIGTFSKTLFPGLRLGYVVVPRGLARDFVTTKLLHDFGGPTIEQAAMARFIADGSFERHVRKAGSALRARREVVLAGLATQAAGCVDVVGAHAGMHVTAWLRGFDRERCDALIELARTRGLGLQSIAPHYLRPPRRSGLLLGYAGLSVRELEAAMEIFGQCVRELAPR